MSAREQFWLHLTSLAESGRPTPCVASRRGWWTSDEAPDQARAIAECATCPALTDCRAFIADNPEPAGVYAALAATDRTPARRHTHKKENHS